MHLGADSGGISDPHRHPVDADPGPLSGHAFFHQRGRRQPDDVREPHLGLGASGGVHTDPARVRGVFRDCRHLQQQAAVRLRVAGMGDHRDHRVVVHRVAASLFHHGRGGQRQRVLRHHDDDHRGADRGENLHLVVHHVPRPRALRNAHAVDPGLYRDLQHRRHDRGAAGGARGRFPAAQQPVPDRALSQRDHRRCGVRLYGRPDVLVPQGVRFPLERQAGPHRLLVLAGGLLFRVHALLRAGFHGHDAPSQSFRQPRVAALAAAGAGGGGNHPLRRGGASLAIVCQHPQPSSIPRPHRRSVGRAHPGMGHRVSPAAVQLRRAAQGQ